MRAGRHGAASSGPVQDFMVFTRFRGAARKRGAGPPIVRAGRHGDASGGRVQDFTVFTTFRGPARMRRAGPLL